jgi:hypothetical protein
MRIIDSCLPVFEYRIFLVRLSGPRSYRLIYLQSEKNNFPTLLRRSPRIHLYQIDGQMVVEFPPQGLCVVRLRSCVFSNIVATHFEVQHPEFPFRNLVLSQECMHGFIRMLSSKS